MHYYKTLDNDAGIALRDSLQALITEGEACELAAQQFARELGADRFVPSIGSDYGGVSALVFDPDHAHRVLFDSEHLLRPIKSRTGETIMAENGTPYFEPNFDFHDQPTRYQKARRMRNRTDCIISEGKLKLSAVINAMSRTDIIKEGLGRKPKFTNEFQILKFRYNHARAEAAASGREAEQKWLKEYSELRTAADFRRVFPTITTGESHKLEKSRSELREAIDALEDTEWSIVVEIRPGSNCKNLSKIQEIARKMYFLPIIHFGDTHRLIESEITDRTSTRPATFVLDDACYIMSEDVALSPGLYPISFDDYKHAADEYKINLSMQ